MIAKFQSVPEIDPDKRFVLGKKGTKNLMVICLNPSTADAYKHDGTSNNLEKIAEANGYDGWALFNVSPERTAHPSELSPRENKDLLTKNSDLIEGFVLINEFKIEDVLVAWGNNIVSYLYPYLPKYAVFILERLQKYELNYLCIKLTDKGHPFHPVAQGINRYIGPVEEIVLQPFNTASYIKMLKFKHVPK